MPNITVEKESKKQRLDLFLLGKFENISRSQIKNYIDAKKVQVNGNVVKSGYIIAPGDVIESSDFERAEMSSEPEDIPLDIIYKDDFIAVINKPQGMVVHPGNGNKNGTLVNALLHHVGKLSSGSEKFRPGIVHRIDKNTSGLIVVAVCDFAHAALAKQIAEHSCKREYMAICRGIFSEKCGTIKTHIARSKKNRVKMAVCQENEGKVAITHYEVLKQFNTCALVHFKLETGRTHQIRVHAAHIGHSIIGDDVYGVNDKKNKLNGQLLHAFKLSFKHPKTEEIMTFEAPLPPYFENFINKL